MKPVNYLVKMRRNRERLEHQKRIQEAGRVDFDKIRARNMFPVWREDLIPVTIEE